MKEWLKAQGISYRKLAASMGSSAATVCKKLNGETPWQQRDCCSSMTSSACRLILSWQFRLMPIVRRLRDGWSESTNSPNGRTAGGIASRCAMAATRWSGARSGTTTIRPAATLISPVTAGATTVSRVTRRFWSSARPAPCAPCAAARPAAWPTPGSAPRMPTRMPSGRSMHSSPPANGWWRTCC